MPRVGASPEQIAPNVLAQLLSLVAHDLRNPLSAIQSSAAFIVDLGRSVRPPAKSPGGPRDDVGEALGDVLLSCQELRHILDNFRSLCHVLEGEPTLLREPTPLRDLVAGAVLECEPLARSRGLTLTLEESASPLTLTHAPMLESVITNLVRNAVAHAPSGSTVRVLITQVGARATLSIEDSGTAIDPAFAEAAFSAEGQLTAKSTRGGRYGRGLGLFTAAAAARAAGAELSALRRLEPPVNVFQVVVAAI